MGIIIALIIALIIIVVIVNAIQQHKAKIEKDRKAKAAKQKAILDENEELLLNLGNLPSSPVLVNILNKRSVNALKAMTQIMPESRALKARLQEFEARLNADNANTEANTEANSDDNFTLPDNEAHLVSILQCIKKLRITLKSEQAKGELDAQTFTKEDQRLDGMQLKINIESLLKRGMKAYNQEMFGSARQYFEKALTTLTAHPLQTEYTKNKRDMVEKQLADITSALANTNAKDAEKKSQEQTDDLDLLFQPKKKW